MSSDQNYPPSTSSSPVQSKLTSLTSKSSFASFFCKKRPILNLTTDYAPEEKPRQVKADDITSNRNDFISIPDNEDEACDLEEISETGKHPSILQSKKNTQELAYISLSSTDSESELPPPKKSSVSEPAAKPVNLIITDFSLQDSTSTEPVAKPSSVSTSFTESLKQSSEPFNQISTSVSLNSDIINVAIEATAKSTIEPPRQYLPAAFDSLDPILRDEMIARLNQARQAGKQTTQNTQNTSVLSEATTNNFNNFHQPPKEYVVFAITQRLNSNTFDKSAALFGKLWPSPTFNMVWKMDDTFGAMKRKIADNLRISPFGLVLIRAEDETELFDTTKPASLNFSGITRPEYSLFFSKKAPKAPSKRAKSSETRAEVSNILARPKDELPLHRLFLYTKTSLSQYKLMHEREKRVLLESLEYLKSTDSETLQSSQDNEDFDQLPLRATNSKIRLTVKTAASRNQSHSISVDPTAKVAEILNVLKSEHKISAKSVVFDGDVLNLGKIIGHVLEDEDMIEIR